MLWLQFVELRPDVKSCFLCRESRAEQHRKRREHRPAHWQPGESTQMHTHTRIPSHEHTHTYEHTHLEIAIEVVGLKNVLPIIYIYFFYSRLLSWELLVPNKTTHTDLNPAFWELIKCLSTATLHSFRYLPTLPLGACRAGLVTSVILITRQNTVNPNDISRVHSDIPSNITSPTVCVCMWVLKVFLVSCL